MKLEQFIETQQLAAKLLAVKWNGEDQPSLAEQGWKFKFANDKRTVGWCKYGSKTIEVSKHYLDSHPDEIRDTILHEIAHALAYNRYGESCGHDHRWRRICIDIGANPTRTTDKAIYGGDYNYTVTCQNDDCPRSGWTQGKHRIKQAYYNYHCKWCQGPITVINLNTGEITYTKPSKYWAEV